MAWLSTMKYGSDLLCIIPERRIGVSGLSRDELAIYTGPQPVLEHV